MFAIDLLNEVERMQEEVNRLFSRNEPVMASGSPAVNLWSGEDGVTVTAELTGVEKDQLDIALHGQTLTIKGSRPEPELKTGERWIRQERSGGQFIRTIELPFNVEGNKVEASYSNGVLRINLPKAEAEKPQRVPVRAA